jgi:hypothetical protein
MRAVMARCAPHQETGMSDVPAVPVFAPGGYRYVRGGFQYSLGVAAEPGHALERVRFFRPLPLAEAFAAIEAHLAAIGRPTTAFAQCELRSPAPFTEQGFLAFNKAYVGTLTKWGLYRDGDPLMNPVARSNVCPAHDGPREPSMYAFSYTVPANGAQRVTFAVAGGADARPGSAPYKDRIVRFGDTSPEALREKGEFVLASMAERMGALGVGWADASLTQLYTVHDVGALVGELIAARGAAPAGVLWHYARPPVIGLEFEMDVLATAREMVL